LRLQNCRSPQRFLWRYECYIGARGSFAYNLHRRNYRSAAIERQRCDVKRSAPTYTDSDDLDWSDWLLQASQIGTDLCKIIPGGGAEGKIAAGTSQAAEDFFMFGLAQGPQCQNRRRDLPQEIVHWSQTATVGRRRMER